ncbi:2-succinyl-5-enolpyruvyl-6-hydroxy-3-cyclohexene-1-carboxylate synthase [Rhodoblastus acidophilus]|uniref:2-succinyl-5-enolpyruvyl-6-hydroxy-3- cyclohexene-1-carboxylic-acid synthase n=1 Tax=Rhodoblastus acidophilus TaxID=1074 RepID=UPI00222431D4|nr:2-succinyl-5-enolpyruvyl-6-hydroxy-3-cyclohexene-1-carboxylic-acid synthase [Rhodoblastus acidophilus]MCW2285960.1 2-succinyl-5-enolpyruvyl-6-hydroxy-3-cyclohexene-1-carboxylate synthase [Rhodoblastus acidophilus]MCW2334854.1 2-succinyl-5-enolpyruvyl-6-hydroxy-3-cyclohexene-1-carboxylate synthase [Rhodoblastus acidophilus]
MSDPARLGFEWAQALLDGFARAGLRRVVASPGSRSTPLTLAALRHPDLAVDLVVDERSAGFFALGLAKAENCPVALIATSGSAIANWAPAVVEADMGRAPLILLSADRPPELLECGANQTMDQNALFGVHVRAFRALPPPEPRLDWLPAFAARIFEASRFPLAGPVHVNVPLREPLTPMGETPLPVAAGPLVCAGRLAPDPGLIERLDALLVGKGVIVCGPDALDAEARAAILDLSRRLDAPVFADLLSGLRFGAGEEAGVLAHPDAVARRAPPFDWALRFGGTPVCRATADWLRQRRGVPQIVVSPHGRFADPDRVATHFVQADVAAVCASLRGHPSPPEWGVSLAEADALAATAADAACSDTIAFEGGVLRLLLQLLPEGAPVFLANSLAIRSAEWFSGRGAHGLRIFGNRGLSGIDGNLSTALGIASALGPAVAVVGDLAFLHDVNALSLMRGRRLTVLLLDNGGGGIFDHLPQAALPEFEQAWTAAQAYKPAALAAGFGLRYIRADTTNAAVAAVLENLAVGGLIVHVAIDRAFSLARCRSFFASCQPEFCS